jgi:hypothetical protein
MNLTEHQRVACALRAVHAIRCSERTDNVMALLATPKPKLQADEDIETMAVVAGEEAIRYNPTFTASLTDSQLLQVTAHELEHWCRERNL